MKPIVVSDSLPRPFKAHHILVIGSLGMLGRDLVTRLHEHKFTVTGLDIPEVDITKPDQLKACLQSVGAEIVVNCAAYTAVDKAESEPEAAFLVNRDGAANLAYVCKLLHIPLMHLSTDYIFDGFAKHPYREDDPANPLSVYGRSKWEGEEAIRSGLREHVILRTSWLFGVHGQNFVKTILRLAREREELKVVADQHGCPTWTGDLADAMIRIIEQTMSNRSTEQWGTYHFCGSGETTWHGFAEAIVKEGRRKESLKIARVLPITTADYPLPAPRPQWSVLDCKKVGRVFGIEPRSWRTGLLEVI